MSYDVSIGDFSHNITFNLSKFFRTYIYPEGLQFLDKKTGSAAAKILASAIANITCALENSSEDIMAEHYSSPNGWGRWKDGFSFLAFLLEACLKHPRKIVRVYS